MCVIAVLVGTASVVAEPARRPARRGADLGASPVLTRQVALVRAGFSVGAIDGKDGPKTRKAMAAWTAAHPNATLPQEPAVTSYVITEQDMAGPFDPSIPDDMMAQGQLEALPYGTVEEALAERFHATVGLIRALNAGVTFEAGTSISVPKVVPMDVPVESRHREAPGERSTPTARVRVSKAGSDLTVTDANGAVVFYAPVSSGSEHDPLPIGTWKVVGVYLRPLFNYNPDLFWDADASHAKTRLPGGPNSPVGLVWIDIDKEHYGLHGTPEPERIGITQSHGCVRLTNWDALHLATLVKTGTEVVFEP